MSLRGMLIAVGAACLVLGVVMWVLAVPPALIVLSWAVILIAGTVYERVIYKPLESRAGAGWTATSERFIDDATGKTVTVYVQTGTGERKYVAE
jgi:membrane protein implicated in regulation of membrane protease activity